MKFVSAFLAVFVFGALAKTPSAPVVIKGECGIVTLLSQWWRTCAFLLWWSRGVTP